MGHHFITTSMHVSLRHHLAAPPPPLESFSLPSLSISSFSLSRAPNAPTLPYQVTAGPKIFFIRAGKEPVGNGFSFKHASSAFAAPVRPSGLQKQRSLGFGESRLVKVCDFFFHFAFFISYFPFSKNPKNQKPKIGKTTRREKWRTTRKTTRKLCW